MSRHGKQSSGPAADAKRQRVQKTAEMRISETLLSKVSIFIFTHALGFDFACTILVIVALELLMSGM
jgi:hypothetical protein